MVSLSQYKFFTREYYVILALSLMQIPALRVYHKYLGGNLTYDIALAFCCVIIGAYIISVLPKLPHNILRLASVIGIGILCVFIYVAYPLADGLKDLMQGSDADDAIILASKALFSGITPYAVTTYFNNPLSPGPGWITLLSPLAICGVYSFSVVVPLLIFWRLMPIHKFILYFLTLASSLFVWELVAVGNDLIIFGMAIALITYILSTYKLNYYQLILITILCGTLCTSRIIFIYIPLLLAFAFIKPYGIKKMVIFTGIALVVTLLWHIVFYNWTQPNFYQPLHILAKGENLAPLWFKVAALGICGVTGVFMLIKRTSYSAYTLTAIGLLIPLSLVSVADLVFTRQWNLALWEGANYLIPALPITILALLSKSKLWQKIS